MVIGPGAVIRDIHIVSPIGCGGMGEVFLGVQETIGREVAIKVIRADRRLDDGVRGRFIREARILGQLEHPNICRLYDSFQIDDTDIIVLELVRGQSLRDLVEASAPETEKLRIADQILAALEAAHAISIIHRDLKPENVMIGSDGTVKVLDFGLARRAQPEAGDQPLEAISTRDEGPPEDAPWTRLGDVLGTPRYLSPEQARGEALTAASDMYVLGLLLHELWTGRSPFSQGLESTAVLNRAMWGEVEPVGDIEPQVATLIRDLTAFAPGDRPSAATARARLRWIRERPARRARRRAVAAVMAALVLAAGLTIAGLVHARRAQHEAESRAREATEITESLAGIFELAKPTHLPGEELTAQQLLVEGEQRLERELADRPRRLARLLEVMASSYLDLGIRHEGERLARRSLVLLREHGAERSLEAADVLCTLAKAMERQDERETKACYRQALSLREQLLGAGHLDTLAVKVELAEQLLRRDSLDEAEALNQQALEDLRALGEEAVHVELRALDAAASILNRRGRHEGAVGLYTELLEHRRRLSGRDDPSFIATLNNLAYSQRMAGDLASAERNYRAALERVERIWGEVHPNRLQVLLNLASVLDLQGRDAEAETALWEVVEMRRALVPAGDWHVGSDLLTGIGRFLMLRGRWSEAERPVREGLAVYEASLRPGHSWIAVARAQLAACLLAMGRDAEAEPLVETSLVVLESLETIYPAVRLGIERGAEYLELAGHADLAVRFRAILSREEAPPAVARVSSPG